MKKIIFPLLAGLLILGSFASSDTKEFEIGEKAPLLQYQMKDIRGAITTIEKTKLEKGVIVVFSCNTCPFVVGSKNFPGWEQQYNELHELATKNGLGFVLVNSNEAKRDNEDSMNAMRIHAKEKGYKMNYLLDENSALADAYGAKTTPHVFVLDNEFHLVYKGSIDNTWDTKRESDVNYLKNVIAEMSKNEKITMPESAPKGCSIKRV